MDARRSFWFSLPGFLTASAGTITAIATLVGALYSAGVIGRRGDAPLDSTQASASPASDEPPVARSDRLRLRSAPIQLSGREVAAALVTRGFYDKRMNAAGNGVTHDYLTRVVGDMVVLIDRATGLMWQHGGSQRAMSFASAEEYVRRLNVEKLAGFKDWRLPTVEEVGSLIEPQAHDEMHISRAFRRGVNFVWTADRHPDGCMWMAYFFDAQFACEKPEFNAWVRGVRSVVETGSGVSTPPRGEPSS